METQRVARGVRDPAALAREIIDANRYMTLATADGDGRPGASPVWYAHQGYTDRWDVADVTRPAPLRLYRARASAHFVLDANDQRLPVRFA